MAWRTLMALLGVGSALAAGCFTNFEKVDTGAGGTGGAGGAGGTGGGPDCGGSSPGVCAFADTFQPFGLASGGTVTVTDIGLRPLESMSPHLYLVGRFTGEVVINGSTIEAEGSGDGFVLELTSEGTYVGHVILPEADATTSLTMAQRTADTSIVVGGHYGEGNSTCPGARGLFMRRFQDGLMEDWSSCVSLPDATSVAAYDVAYSELEFATLVGDVAGSVGPHTAEQVDGFIATFATSMQGVNPTYVFAAGGGNASIRRVMPNPVDDKQWLVAGDFDGELSISGQAGTVDSMAMGPRDLFLASVDEEMMMPNLALAPIRALDGGVNRLVELDPFGAGAVMLAEVSGPVTDGTKTIDAPASGASLLAMTFAPPNDEGPGYSHVDHFLFTGGDVSVHALHATDDAIAIGAGASTDVALERDGDPEFGEVDTTLCAEDALLTVLRPGSDGYTAYRCGQAGVAITAIQSDETGQSYFAAIDVPSGATMLTDDGPIGGPAVVIAVARP